MLEILQISLITTVFVQLMEPGMIFAFYGRLISRLPIWLYNPLGGCVKCFTGQVAFWFYVIKYFDSYNFFDHLFFVSAAIFLSLIYDKLWQTLSR
jgi:hypothetical protein